jgi:hypothetical protein
VWLESRVVVFKVWKCVVGHLSFPFSQRLFLLWVDFVANS